MTNTSTNSSAGSTRSTPVPDRFVTDLRCRGRGPGVVARGVALVMSAMVVTCFPSYRSSFGTRSGRLIESVLCLLQGPGERRLPGPDRAVDVATEHCPLEQFEE